MLLGGCSRSRTCTWFCGEFASRIWSICYARIGCWCFKKLTVAQKAARSVYSDILPIDSSDLALMCMVDFFCFGGPGSNRLVVRLILFLLDFPWDSWLDPFGL